MIVRDHPALSLSRQCRLLSLGRSSLYYKPKGESEETLALMRRIDELFLKYPFYGARQMVRHLRREGVRIGRRRAGRLMGLLGLQAVYRAPRTSDPHPEPRVWPYLLKDLRIDRPNHVWCADITYWRAGAHARHLQARRQISPNPADPWRPFGAHHKQGAARLGGAPRRAATGQCRHGCAGQQDGAHDLGPAGP